MKLAMAALCLFGFLCAGAQVKTRELRFQTQVQAGLIAGDQADALQLQAIGGVRYRGWSAGLGAGLDYYKMRSIPVFLDLRRNLFGGRQSFFAYADGGLHIPWRKSADGHLSYDAGPYYDLGLGCRFPAGSHAVTLSAGYSLKAYQMKKTYTICPFTGPCYEEVYRYAYKLRRLSFKAGFSF